MASNETKAKNTPSNEFTKQAELGQQGLLGEFVDYLRNNKKWWLTPIVIVLLLVGGLILLGGTAAAPFIYTLF